MKKAFYFFILTFAACQTSVDKSDVVLAECNGKKLYRSEVLKNIPHLEKSSDSISMINLRVEEWMRNHLLLDAAQKEVKDQDIESMVKSYREELIITEFENKLIDQKLDTTVNKAQIEAYMTANELTASKKTQYIKVKFGKVKSGTENLEKLDLQWEEKNWGEIKEYCSTFAEICLLGDDWIILTELKQYFSESIFDSSVLKKKGYHQKSKNNYEYFLWVEDFKTEENKINQLEENKIRKLILHQRANTIVKDYKEELYQKSLEEQKIKFYLN